MLEEIALETLFRRRLRLPEDPRQQPDAGLDQQRRGGLATGEHHVPDRDLFEVASRDDALVEPLEATADEHHARPRRQLPHPRLAQRNAARSQENPGPRIRGKRVERRGDNIGPEHHTGAPARGRVVNGAVLMTGEVANVQRVQGP